MGSHGSLGFAGMDITGCVAHVVFNDEVDLPARQVLSAALPRDGLVVQLLKQVARRVRTQAHARRHVHVLAHNTIHEFLRLHQVSVL